jgi:hypothetical protein
MGKLAAALGVVVLSLAGYAALAQDLKDKTTSIPIRGG